MFITKIILMLLMVAPFLCYSQSGVTDEQLKKLQDKKIDFHKSTDGEYDGYRIKIHFGSDRAKAMEVKSKFLSKFSDYAAYDEYQLPNFVIVVGDFKTKPEAYAFLKEVQVEFVNAFIVKDKIKSGK